LQIGNYFSQIVMMPRCIAITMFPNVNNDFILVYNLYPTKEVPVVCMPTFSNLK
jgi:hypothetical protein